MRDRMTIKREVFVTSLGLTMDGMVVQAERLSIAIVMIHKCVLIPLTDLVRVWIIQVGVHAV